MSSSFLGVRLAGRALVVVVLALALAVTAAPVLVQAAPAASRHNEPDYRTYVVRQGDSLSSIALRFGVSQEALMRANGIRNPNVIYVGQVLIIPGGLGPVPVPSPKPGEPTTYIVKRGDTLGDIAKRFNTTVQAIMQANNIRNPNRIEVGQVLLIPGQGGKDPGGKDPVPPARPPVTPPSKDPCCLGPVHPPVTPPSKEPVKPAPIYPPVYQPDKEPVKPAPIQPPVYQPGKDPCCLAPVRPAHPPAHKPDPGPKPTGHWVGQYYAGKYFDELIETRHDPEIRFNWYKDSPGAGIPEDRFSIRWERHEHFQAGWYRFYALADDGVRVYVDGTLIIDAWQIQPATQYTADVYLTTGVHHLSVDYFEETEDAQIHVYYEPLHKQPPVTR